MSSLLALMGGGFKSSQSGSALAAGTITITAVNTAKAFVLSVSKGSAGYVAARGSITLTPSSAEAAVQPSGASGPETGPTPSYSGSLTGGTTDLTTAQYSARLTSSTQITVDGPCEWQVIEYY